MSSLKEIKSRIASVKNTLKITSAMKMVASAKLHKAQTAIAGKLPYEQKLHHILAGILQDDDLQKSLHDELGFGNPHGHSPVMLQDISLDELPSRDKVSRVAIVAVSSSSSMCGSFNATLIRQFDQTMDQLLKSGYSKEDVDLYVVGKKIADHAGRKGYHVEADLSEIAGKPDYDAAVELADALVESFSCGEVSQVILLYSHFDSTSSQPVVRENYLPLALHEYGYTDEPVDYILEPDPLQLVRDLLPKVLKLKMYAVLLDASAAEHAARTLAMQIASDNAKDLISELTLEYNKSRQQAITAEILDLVGGSFN